MTPARARSRMAGAALVTAGAGALIVAASMPWVRTGARRRSSFELVAVAERLGLARNGGIATAARLWPIVVLLCTVAAVAAWWGWRWVAFGCGVAAGLYAVGFALVLRRRRLPPTAALEAGPGLALPAAALLVAASIAGLYLCRPA